MTGFQERYRDSTRGRPDCGLETSFLETASLDKYFIPSELPTLSTQLLEAYDRTVCLSLGSSKGSGVLLKDQYILTCSHILSSFRSGADPSIDFLKQIRVTYKLAEFDLENAVVEIDNPDLDFAIIKAPKLRVFSMINTELDASLFRDDRCYLIGNPSNSTFGRPEVARNTKQVISIGRIETVSDTQVFLHGPTVNPGYSGGPIIARNGALLGIISEQYRSGGCGPNMSAILSNILANKPL